MLDAKLAPKGGVIGMPNPNEEFIALALTREESDKWPDIELRLTSMAGKLLLTGRVAVILVCDEIEGQIRGFESISRVFFFNRTAWDEFEAGGMILHPTRVVNGSDVPSDSILLGNSMLATTYMTYS